MKILVIGQQDSQHSVKFLTRVRSTFPSATICFFPSQPFAYSPSVLQLCDDVYAEGLPRPVPDYIYWPDLFARPLSVHSGDPRQLAAYIQRIQPDVVHVCAIQDAGYLLDEALEQGLVQRNFKINLSVWGLDLAYFRHNPAHAARIQRFLPKVDLLIPESSREMNLARMLGFTGLFTPPIQATLATFDEIIKLHHPEILPPKEKLILIKNAGQSDRCATAVVLKSLYELRKEFDGYSVHIINPSNEDFRNLEPFTRQSHVRVIYSGFLPYPAMVKQINAATFAMSINLADGVSNFFLECCAAKTYPVLSTSASVEDWLYHDNITTLDPYDFQAAVQKLHALVTDQPRVAQSVLLNFESLRRYSTEYVTSVVNRFY